MIITRLSLANLKKKKGASITLIIIIVLATTLLSIGITLLSKTESIYEHKEKVLNGPQFVAMSSANTYKKDYEDFVFNDDRVALAEKEEVIYMPTTKNNKNTLELRAVIFNLDTNRKIAPLIPIDEDTTIPKEKAIYVPLMLKSYNVTVGDDYDIIYKGKTYSFIVAGFFESTYFSTSTNGTLKYFVPKESFEALYSEIGRATILSARFKETGNGSKAVSEDFAHDFKNSVNKQTVSGEADIFYLSSATLKSDYMSFISIDAAIIIALALVICIIILSVIYNRVVESIDECMQNIGILGSIGYTTKQIMVSFILEYLLLSIVGFIVGIILSYSIDPILSRFLNSTGMIWNSGIHIPEDILCLCIVLFSIGFIAFLGSIRIIKLPPVKALNKATDNHRFKKNRCPLHKGVSSIHIRIGMKNLFSNIKSNISFTLIVAGGIFAIGLSLVMYMNFAVDKSALLKMTGFELSDLQISVTKHTDTKKFANELLAMREVRKTNLSDVTTAKLENNDIQVIVSDNFNAMEVLSTYEGVLPRYDNEIAITGVMSNKLHKGIGDAVRVTAGGKTQEYYITGIYQTTNNSGYMSILPMDGIKKLCPQYEIGQIDIYLKEGVNKELFKEKLRSIYKVAVKDDNLSKGSKNNTSTTENEKYSKAKAVAEEKISKLLADYGITSASYTVMQDGKVILSGDSSAYKINEITDLKDYISGQLDSLGSMISVMVTVIAVITFLVIGGILSITINSLIRKKREEYGIYKAIGYTTKELVRQLSIEFVITSMIGTILGSIATLLLSNSILQLLFTNIGLTRLTLNINIVALIILGGCLIIFIYLMALVKAYKIKKITAYELITE